MSAIHRSEFPRGALIAAGLIAAVAIVGAGLSRQARLAAPAVESATPLAARDLTFADASDGAVVVRDAAGAVVFVAPPGGENFMRGVLRSFARDRRARGVGPEPGFRLAIWPDGRLSLADLATGKTVELSAFGADNRAAFMRLLPPPARSAT